MTYAMFSDVLNPRMSLAEELARLGMPSIDPAKVHAHKRDMLAKNRTGMWRHFFFLPLFMFRTLHMGFNVWLWLSLICGVVGATWALGMSEEYLELGTLGSVAKMTTFGLVAPTVIWLGTFLAMLAITALLEYLDEGNGCAAFDAAGSFWYRVAYDSTSGNRAIPRQVRDLAARVSLLNDVELRLEYFQEDPFLLVSRGFFFRETVYIAAWNTGNSTLNTI